MFIPFLVAFRETFEAALIIGVLIGVLKKFSFGNQTKIVIKATISASVVTFMLLLTVSVLGQQSLSLITDNIKEIFEGIMLLTSSFFITWAVFWLHTHLQYKRGKHVITIHEKIKLGDFNGFFFMVFTLIIREGIEIVLFLSPLIFSTSPLTLLSGALIGTIAASLLGFLIYTATIRINLKRVFRYTTALLVIFSAGLLIRGIGSLTDAHLLPQTSFLMIKFSFFPQKESIISEILNTFLGIGPTLSFPQYSSYLIYLIAIYFGLNRQNIKNPKPYVSKN